MTKTTKTYENSIQIYLQEISIYPLLSAEEEIAEFTLYASLNNNCALLEQQARNTQGGLARTFHKSWKKEQKKCNAQEQKLITANLRLVVHLLKKFASYSFQYHPDLIQEGNIGLTSAVRNFRLQEGCRFSTYAHYWIYQAMSRYLSHKNPLITIPLHVSERNNKIKRFLQEQTEADNHAISQALNISEKHIENLEDLPLFQQSLNTPCHEDSTEHKLDRITDDQSLNPAELSMQSDFLNVLSRELNSLTEQEQYIINKRFGLNDENPQTLKQISLYFQCSRERIRQIEANAIETLRKRMNEKEYIAR